MSIDFFPLPAGSSFTKPASITPGRVAALGALVVAALTGGCATYEPLPLGVQSRLVHDVPHLVVDRSLMPLPELREHVFDASDGLDMTEAAMLAVANNPDLRIARDDSGIARAQAFSASLLPDPQLGLTRDFVRGVGAGYTSAYNLGVTYDFLALLTHSSTRAAASADAQKTDLNLLWQEWQVVSQARILFIKLEQGKKLLGVLERSRALFEDRYVRTRTALERGLLTSNEVTPYLTALQDVQKQLNALEIETNLTRHAFNALLGLAPDVDVQLVGDNRVPEIDAGKVAASLADLPRRRPDLIALEYGYRAQDARYRAALLGQFPALTFGPTRARDTSNVNTIGFSVGVSVPIFNRNRGVIAIEKATRQKLHDDYTRRIDVSTSEIDRILTEQRLITRQLVALDAAIASLQRVADRSAQAFVARNIDALTLTNVQNALLARQVDRITLQQSLFEQRVTLQSLLGGELPLATQDSKP